MPTSIKYICIFLHGHTLGLFSLNNRRRCTECFSLWHQSTARTIREHWIHLLSYRSRGTLMSYTEHSVQCRLKSNAPYESAQWTHISTSAILQMWWHTPPFQYKHQDIGEKIWLHQGTNYSVHEHLVLTSYLKLYHNSCTIMSTRYWETQCIIVSCVLGCSILHFVVIVCWLK